MKFFLVDDEETIIKATTILLEGAGHDVTGFTSSIQAMEMIKAGQPDCLIVDIMMPEMDGLELCRKVKSDPDTAHIRVIVLSAKTYEFDRSRAQEMGAEGYLTKPIKLDTFVAELDGLLGNSLTATFWGVRGTLPVPGESSLRYGGHTSCVTVQCGNSPLMIFDAGSGIKALSDHMMGMNERITAKIFISHPHWDHINALPFFVPLYIPGNEFEILGARHGDTTMRELMSAQMDGIYFPITIREFGARVFFRDLGEETIEFDDIKVQTMLLSHPGNCLGYRIDYQGKSICYITDNEMFNAGEPGHNPGYIQRLADFCRGADALITDTTYTDAQYPAKAGWGHSSVGQVAELAARAEVDTLYLFHHDPDQNDDAIDAKLDEMKMALSMLGSDVKCLAPGEGDQIKH
ncbi:MAG: response regulator [Alphaproteobacteria bacterium]|jgi:phosphoribosyl 1,2-cyclic phosphodiesterase|nr:response regulator [Alphaproteobacteria bacterium]MBT4086715.1 response regulator [Alphaproteobacteria bacterium]MBT4545359.1 response regulator [Alphaproteobacteria bacterium]MBT6387080.1 response regulator [Alphaproteobacteria bacterium]MBT7744755.1 response regulator [Alphaproteobacteria bacterium]